MSVLAVSSIAEVEQWPVGQIVVTDAAHLTPLWRQVGAAAVIVLVQRAEDASNAGERGATHCLQPPPPPDVVATMVLALAAPSGPPKGLSEQPGYQPLPIQCPKCQHIGCVLTVKSVTVLSWTCARCKHFWATEMDALPPDVQDKVFRVLNDL